MEEAVTAFDLKRMLLGDEPPLFLLEIAVRTVIIYVYTLLLIRWLGARSVAQLSMFEFLLVIALGSAVGDAMFYPNVPLFHSMIVITVVVLLDKLLSILVARGKHAEKAIEGKAVPLVDKGRIFWERLREVNLGYDELFEQLRLAEIKQLGQVNAAYFESNGQLSVFKFDDGKERPGLAISPPWDVKKPEEHRAGEQVVRGGYACTRCGTTLDIDEEESLPDCRICGAKIWHRAAEGAASALGER